MLGPGLDGLVADKPGDVIDAFDAAPISSSAASPPAVLNDEDPFSVTARSF